MSAAKTKAQSIIDENAVGMDAHYLESLYDANTNMLQPSLASPIVPIA